MTTKFKPDCGGIKIKKVKYPEKTKKQNTKTRKRKGK